jgi:archaellum component FlaC
MEAANLIEEEVGKKDDMINALNVQINTKDALIESLEKRVNEVKKINDTFIEKFLFFLIYFPK